MVILPYRIPVKIINDKIVKIRLPRVKSVPTNYNKISYDGIVNKLSNNINYVQKKDVKMKKNKDDEFNVKK